MKERIIGFVIFFLAIGFLVALFFGMSAYEKSDKYMDSSYDVWFEGENAQQLAAKSEKLGYSPNNFVYLLKVGEEMELQDVIQHRFYRNNQGGNISYSIQYKNEQNELVDYQFSYFEQVKIVYKSDITKPILKRTENDVYQNNNRTTVKIPKYMNFIIYMPEKSNAMRNQNHYETCRGNKGNNNYRCETSTVESESLLNE